MGIKENLNAEGYLMHQFHTANLGLQNSKEENLEAPQFKPRVDLGTLFMNGSKTGKWPPNYLLKK